MALFRVLVARVRISASSTLARPAAPLRCSPALHQLQMRSVASAPPVSLRRMWRGVSSHATDGTGEAPLTGNGHSAGGANNNGQDTAPPKDATHPKFEPDGRFVCIGAGKMAEAIIGGVLRSGTPRDRVVACDVNPKRCDGIQRKFSIQAHHSSKEVVREAGVVLLAVKPQTASAVLAEIREYLPRNALVVSIVAGVSIEAMEKALDFPDIVRTMPNTPAAVGMSMTVWTCRERVSHEHRALAKSLLRSFGSELFVADESYIDMATALSGTGPAYFFMIVEAMIDAGVHMGFPRDVARDLALQTMAGSVALMQEYDLHPAELRNNITSPGGTTAAAIYAAERGGLRTVLSDALWAAYRRSLEMGNKNSCVGPDRFRPVKRWDMDRD
eukprot:m.304487 g.304487  ORF g.304487 m.304487 type:complete len:386 (-) comp16945_c0_seq1:156-1313(-)